MDTGERPYLRFGLPIGTTFGGTTWDAAASLRASSSLASWTTTSKRPAFAACSRARERARSTESALAVWLSEIVPGDPFEAAVAPLLGAISRCGATSSGTSGPPMGGPMGGPGGSKAPEPSASNPSTVHGKGLEPSRLSAAEPKGAEASQFAGEGRGFSTNPGDHTHLHSADEHPVDAPVDALGVSYTTILEGLRAVVQVAIAAELERRRGGAK